MDCDGAGAGIATLLPSSTKARSALIAIVSRFGGARPLVRRGLLVESIAQPANFFSQAMCSADCVPYPAGILLHSLTCANLSASLPRDNQGETDGESSCHS